MILGHVPSPATLSAPFALGTQRHILSPVGSVSMTTRFLLHSSSCNDEFFSDTADAVRGLNVAKESLDSGVRRRRETCVGSN